MNTKQYGAVSLFIVIFSMLLITIVTVSFIRIMLQDQQQASTQDLSQSAYDSAQAGVEDAKRAILQYQSICATGTQTACDNAAAVLKSTDCNAGLAGIQTYVPGSEVQVQQTQSAGDVSLNQAYTCVTINLQTPDYIGVLPANASKVIPLVVPAGSTFNTVTIQWFASQDLGASSNSAVDLQPLNSTVTPLLTAWPANRPSVMRAELMQVGSSFTLNNFDNSAGGQSDVNTLFLYPSANQADTQTSFSVDQRKTKNALSGAQLVTCKASLSSGGYACSINITLPDPINGGARTAYLRLTPLYNKTNYKVILSNGDLTNPTLFNGVQPEVDSTGRANDLFRRVQSRVEVVDPAFPDAAVDITGSFCKDFSVTNLTTDYNQSSACSP